MDNKIHLLPVIEETNYNNKCRKTPQLSKEIKILNTRMHNTQDAIIHFNKRRYTKSMKHIRKPSLSLPKVLKFINNDFSISTVYTGMKILVPKNSEQLLQPCILPGHFLNKTFIHSAVPEIGLNTLKEKINYEIVPFLKDSNTDVGIIPFTSPLLSNSLNELHQNNTWCSYKHITLADFDLPGVYYDAHHPNSMQINKLQPLFSVTNQFIFQIQNTSTSLVFCNKYNSLKNQNVFKGLEDLLDKKPFLKPKEDIKELMDILEERQSCNNCGLPREPKNHKQEASTSNHQDNAIVDYCCCKQSSLIEHEYAGYSNLGLVKNWPCSNNAFKHCLTNADKFPIPNKVNNFKRKWQGKTFFSNHNEKLLEIPQQEFTDKTVKYSFCNGRNFSQEESNHVLTNKLSSIRDCNFESNFCLENDDVFKSYPVHSPSKISFSKMLCDSFLDSKFFICTNISMNNATTMCTLLDKNILREQLAKEEQLLNEHNLLRSDTMIANVETVINKQNTFLVRKMEDKHQLCVPQSINNNKLSDFDNTISKRVCETTYYTPENPSNKSEKRFKQSAEFQHFDLVNHSQLFSLAPESFPLKTSLDICSTIVSSHCTIPSFIVCPEGKDLLIKNMPPSGSLDNSSVTKEVLNNSIKCVSSQMCGIKFEKCNKNSLVQPALEENVNKIANEDTGIDTSKRTVNVQLLEEFSTSKSTENLKSYHQLEVNFDFDTVCFDVKQPLKETNLSLENQEIREGVFSLPIEKTKVTMQSVFNLQDYSREEVLPITSNKAASGGIHEPVELNNVFKCNNLFQIEFFNSSSSDEFFNANPSIKNPMTNTIQFDDTSTDEGNVYEDIERVINDSISKYEHFTSDVGVLATPNTSEKSSQTETVCLDKRFLCKRCLSFDDEDLEPLKRSKSVHKNKVLNPFELENTGMSTKKTYLEIGCANISNVNNININNPNNSNDLYSLRETSFESEHLMLSNQSSLIKYKEKTLDVPDSFYNETRQISDDTSLYDENEDVEHKLNLLSKGSGSESDHKVPTTGEEVGTTEELITGPSSIATTPNKPILRLGLSRSARLKPLHKKYNF